MRDQVNDLDSYIAAVTSHVEETRHAATAFAREGLTTHAIPFFGDVTAARLLTLGVNPSAGEFVGREWPPHLTSSELSARLVGYFRNLSVPPHPWFATWTEALRQIGLSYKEGAAHLDLSARATLAMGSHADWKGFADLMALDAKWFFALLPLCNNAKALLMAGCVTKRWYIDDFVAKIAPEYGYRLDGRSARSGNGRVGFRRLVGLGCDLPVFFCSVSPSGRNRQILIERVREHRGVLVEWTGNARDAGGDR